MFWQQHPASKPLLESAIRATALALAWVLLWRLSAVMEYAPHASIWFPPAGLTLAAFLVMGWRAAAAILPAAVLVTFWTDALYELEQTRLKTLLGGLLFASAHAGSYWAGAAVLRWMGNRSPGPSLPAFIIAFLVIASAAALLAALLGVEALILGGSLERSHSTGLWLPWWIGDMAAAVTLTPLFAGLLGAGRRARQRWFPVLDLPATHTALGSWMLKLLVLLLMLALIMSITALIDRDELLAFAVFFLIIPQMWITYTESAFRVAISLAAFSTMIAIGVSLLGLDERAMVYQFAITVIAASTWFGLAVPTLVAQNRRLQRLADADELTGVTSRRYFYERSREEIEIARLRGQLVSLVVFDIDRFKQINDRYGHTRGDTALVETARAVRRHLRREDLFGRFGGDEFMLLMVDCSADRAVARAEELRLALHEIRNDETGESLSGSFSVIELERDESIAEAFERADAGLLAAKRAGRDRVVCGAAPVPDTGAD